MVEKSEPIDINKKLEKDLKYIENDIIVKHIKLEGNEQKYIKFCKPLNAIAILDLTEKQYINYWYTQYSHYPEKKEIITQAIIEKFKNGLTSTEEMIEILNNSKDIESERNKALSVLGGIKNE